MTNPSAAKQFWRSRFLAARRARPESEREAARKRIGAHLLALVEELAATDRPPTICLYLPLPTEPLDPALPGQLADLGFRVLVPVAELGLPLDWVELTADRPESGSAAARGALGVVEPTGPRRGAHAIAAGDLIVVPALAVDRRGVRLGRGGGFYDRSLALLPAGFAVRVIAVVFDDEFVAELPRDEHDVTVAAVVTPDGGLQVVAGGS